MINILKRYRTFLLLLMINALIIVFKPDIGLNSIKITWNNTLEMLSIIPPIFIMLGLLDVWVQRETMVRFMGEKSGIIGIVIAFLMGSAAAGPLYGAFPVAGVLLKKGAKLSNILIFIGAWSTTKIPLLLFEASSLGWKFMITRFIIDIPGIIIIASVIEKLMNRDEKALIYENAQSL